MFTDDVKVRIRHLLGYQNVGAIATFAMGVPAAFQTTFQLESAMNKVLPEAESLTLKLLDRCEAIEEQMGGDMELLAIEQLGTITISKEEMDKLRKEYLYHRDAVANVFGVPANPFDFRFMGGSGLNVTVQH